MEIIQFIFSSFWVFVGSLFAVLSILFVVIQCSGWAINAILIGWQGKKCDDVGLIRFN